MTTTVWGTAGLGASAHQTASQLQKALGWHYRTADVVAASNDLLASAAKAVQGMEFNSSRTGPRPGLCMSVCVCVARSKALMTV